MQDEPTEIVFNPYQDSCPFRRDNKCSSACSFFEKRVDSFIKLGTGGCRLLGEGIESSTTGYFYERTKQPYGNYY